jgi:HNH endonuclease
LPFTERLKLSVKRKAHFSCCLCHALGVEVHHIISQEEGGPDTEKNAAPLCASCHETYGANPQKRKFIREARDFWYELCAKRYASDADRLDKILSIVEGTATKSDVGTVNSRIVELGEIVQNSLSNLVERERYVLQIDQMQQRLIQIQNDLQTNALSMFQLSKRNSVAQLGADISIEIARDRYSDLDQKQQPLMQLR